MSEFKVGDKIICISKSWLFNDLYLREFTISSFDGEHFSLKESNAWLTEKEMVLSEIYNSPLYKLLQEEENV